mmetsp:Transcript_9819/g.18473  ORF Transcript_9819/g.18473 Transcript_9819/m.18473 type:complete len:216 (+) Transcript_9819:1813-2460(+)
MTCQNLQTILHIRITQCIYNGTSDNTQRLRINAVSSLNSGHGKLLSSLFHSNLFKFFWVVGCQVLTSKVPSSQFHSPNLQIIQRHSTLLGIFLHLGLKLFHGKFLLGNTLISINHLHLHSITLILFKLLIAHIPHSTFSRRPDRLGHKRSRRLIKLSHIIRIIRNSRRSIAILIHNLQPPIFLSRINPIIILWLRIILIKPNRLGNILHSYLRSF